MGMGNEEGTSSFDISEVAQRAAEMNKKKLKLALADEAGIDVKKVDDTNLSGVKTALHGAKAIADSGGDPQGVPVSQLKEAATGTPDESPEEDISNQQKITMALTAILPTIAGYAFGGKRGAAVGADAGAKGVTSYISALGDERKEKKALNEKKAERAEKYSEAALARADKADENEKNRQMQERLGNQRADDQKEYRRGMQSLQKDRMGDKKEKDSEKIQEKNELLQTPFGMARTADDAKKVKNAAEIKDRFDDGLSQMIALRKSNGGGAIMDREAVAIGKQLSKDLLLDYKDLKNLGVLSASDINILDTIIPSDPLEFRSPVSAVQGQDPVLAKMESFKSRTNKSFQSGLKNRIRDYQPPEEEVAGQDWSGSGDQYMPSGFGNSEAQAGPVPLHDKDTSKMTVDQKKAFRDQLKKELGKK